MSSLERGAIRAKKKLLSLICTYSKNLSSLSFLSKPHHYMVLKNHCTDYGLSRRAKNCLGGGLSAHGVDWGWRACGCQRCRRSANGTSGSGCHQRGSANARATTAATSTTALPLYHHHHHRRRQPPAPQRSAPQHLYHRCPGLLLALFLHRPCRLEPRPTLPAHEPQSPPTD